LTNHALRDIVTEQQAEAIRFSPRRQWQAGISSETRARGDKERYGGYECVRFFAQDAEKSNQVLRRIFFAGWANAIE
jgi:hypothetical protein